MKLQGNTILVAGGASGIGRGLAELLCRLGNEVIVFGPQPDARSAVRTPPGLRAIELDLADPWRVASFAEQVGATHPRLNMLVNIAIAFPVKYLPGLHALDGDDTLQAIEAHRLGVQQLTGTLLGHLRKQAHGSVVNVSAGPVLAPSMAPAMTVATDGGCAVSTMAVRKRWATASVEVIDVSRPTRAERVSPEHTAAAGLPLPGFLSRVANLLAEGLHEDAAVKRLQALWPVPGVVAQERRDERRDERLDDDRVSEAA